MPARIKEPPASACADGFVRDGRNPIPHPPASAARLRGKNRESFPARQLAAEASMALGAKRLSRLSWISPYGVMVPGGLLLGERFFRHLRRLVEQHREPDKRERLLLLCGPLRMRCGDGAAVWRWR
ncbi:hypothetical protein GCM10022214_26940 [Actinomadura miaoliensis]|uniref:Uncharacterized protein n=2 Tax=Actinomadura miaoliensis TaxID=430685 RepID=A0ABP7VP82_9ACTN